MQKPLSIRTAAQTLLQWAEIQHSAPALPTSRASRFQIPVLPGHAGLLTWLRAQTHSQKLYFRSPSPYCEVAAVGFLHKAAGPLFTEPTYLALLSSLDPEYPNQRYYGAARFDPARGAESDPQWRPFEGYTFVLPAVELLISSDGVYRLAANYHRKDGIHVLRKILSALVPTPTAMTSLSPLIPRAARVSDVTQFSDWDAAMQRILTSLERKHYDKIVLARRKRFQFHSNAAPAALDILAALEHQSEAQSDFTNATRTRGNTQQANSITYLFCLQLDHDIAFLGNTPERLFRLDDAHILTEALAGTVRRGVVGDEGELLSELLGVKNLQEHAFVVDYITTALANCGVRPQTTGPNVLRLPRLMHLATHIRGQFPSAVNDAFNAEENLVGSSSGRLFRLLRAMHPTPAVCGMPREQTIEEIAKLEGFDRGLFAGPFGWFSREAGEFCVAIRSALVHGCDVTAFAGCGIVQGSESKSEWDESELKLSSFTDLFRGDKPKPNGAVGSRYLKLVTRDSFMDVAVQAKTLTEEKYVLNSSLSLEYGHGAVHLMKDSAAPPNFVNEDVATFSPKILSGTVSTDSMSSLLAKSTRNCSNELESYFDPEELRSLPNLNTLWGCCCVEELCRNGVDTFFIAPGSRSAPLAVGVVRSRYAKAYVAHDERGAGFLAVGYARANGRAAVVITTSGTAVANLLSAVIEASMDSLPMILVTADRPSELRDVGANQAIYQANIFGTYTRWAKDIPCPCEDIPLRSLLSDVDYAVFMSGGNVTSTHQHGQLCAGPVHLNMMFREKLAPELEKWDHNYVAGTVSKWQKSVSPLTIYRAYQNNQAEACSTANTRNFEEAKSFRALDCIFRQPSSVTAGVIILGGGSGSVQSEDDGLIMYEIAKLLGWPIVSDICGGLRLDNSREDVLIRYADQILVSPMASHLFSPDAVIQFGERITSKRLCNLIRACSASQDDFLHVVVSKSGKRCDPLFTVTHHIYGTVEDFLEECKIHRAAVERGSKHAPENGIRHEERRPWNASKLNSLVQLSAKIDETFREMMSGAETERLTEPRCARLLSENLAGPGALFIGNSMPVRDLDAFAGISKDGLKIRIAANRGASGIDGIVSSGIGFGVGLGLDVTIIVGDMSMIHDLNSLHLLRNEDCSIPIQVTIVVVNNGGGGIFSMLPIAKHRDVFSPWFDSPHGVEFGKACEMFGIQHIAVRSVKEMNEAFAWRRRNGGKHLIVEAVVCQDHAGNAALHQRLGAAAAQQVCNFIGTKK